MKLKMVYPINPQQIGIHVPQIIMNPHYMAPIEGIF
jgi:hypothetical protein